MHTPATHSCGGTLLHAKVTKSLFNILLGDAKKPLPNHF